MRARSYRFHDFNLSVSAEEAVLAALHARLGRFPAGSTRHAADLRFEFHKTADPSRPVIGRPAGTARPVLDLGRAEVVYSDASQQLYVDIPGHGEALCEIRSRRVHVSYPEAEAADPWLLSHPLFTIPLAEVAKRLGLYPVHAAGLAIGGKGVLVAGQSGAGKTTLALALLRGGFAFLADDTVFLSAGKPGLRVLAFPDEADVTAQTMGFFPELQRLRAVPNPNGRLKQRICATSLYEVRPCWECTPAVIVFPQTERSKQSILTPMPKAEALLQLVCNVLRTEPRSSQAHLDTLAELVKSCRCYRLHTARDFDRLPGLVRSALEQTEPHFP